MTAGEYLKRELSKVACGTYEGEDNISDLVELWKKPWGIELCKNINFPTSAFFEQYEQDLLPYGVFRNQNGLKLYNRDVVLYHSTANLEFSLPERTYSVLLYAGAEVVITATNCAVVKVSKINNDCTCHIITERNATVICN
ncbi:MAG: hypothetical protein II937_13835 [Bacteroidales bacterium]|nr:hypothetical protein [Bacteroidales bacterium]